jgi:ParB family chromosome partitioning protein
MNVQSLPLNQVNRDPNNPRKEWEERRRAEFFASIREHGVKVPVLVFKTHKAYMLIDGHCRLEAALAAEHTEIPAVVFDHQPDAGELLLTQTIINCQRSDLNPIDLAESYESLMRLKKWNNSELAKNLSISSSTVTRVTSVLKLSPEDRQALREAGANSSAAYALVRMEPEDRPDYLARLVRGEVSRDALNRKARKKKGRISRFVCELPSSTITFVSKLAVTIELLISELEEALKHCKKGQREGWDAVTLSRIIRTKKASE